MIVAAGFSHLRLVNPSIPGTVMRETLEGIEYLWVKTPAYRGNGLGRVLNMAMFMLRLSGAAGLAIADFRPHLVIASSTYTWDNWLAARYARIFHAKYVYEVHDLWPLTPMELAGMSRANPFIWSLQRAEDFACRKADKVVSLLPAAESHLAAHGMEPRKFAYIPNGIVEDEWEHGEHVPDAHVEALAGMRREVRCLVGYVGGHGLSNALDALIVAGADPRLKNVGIVCVGDGPEKNRLKEKARRLRSNVHFLPSVPKRSVPGLLGLFDILYIGWAQSSLYRFGISPNKLFEYMRAGLPILHAVAAANDPVQEAACGLSVRPEDQPALIDGICKMAALSREERKAMGQRGRRYVETYHRLGRLARDYLDFVCETRDWKTI